MKNIIKNFRKKGKGYNYLPLILFLSVALWVVLANLELLRESWSNGIAGALAFLTLTFVLSFLLFYLVIGIVILMDNFQLFEENSFINRVTNMVAGVFFLSALVFTYFNVEGEWSERLSNVVYYTGLYGLIGFLFLGLPIIWVVRSNEWMFGGLSDLGEARRVQNIPTSSIQTGAVGSQVEIKGKFVDFSFQGRVAPLSESYCRFFCLKIMALKFNKVVGDFTTLSEEVLFSEEFLFISDGQDGLAAVDVNCIEDWPEEGLKRKLRKFGKNSTSLVPKSLVEFLVNHREQIKAFNLIRACLLQPDVPESRNDSFQKETNSAKDMHFQFEEFIPSSFRDVYMKGFAHSGLDLMNRMIRNGWPDTGKYALLESKSEDLGNNLSEPTHKNEKGRQEFINEIRKRVKLAFLKDERNPVMVEFLPEQEVVKHFLWSARLQFVGAILILIVVSYLVFYQFDVFTVFRYIINK